MFHQVDYIIWTVTCRDHTRGLRYKVNNSVEKIFPKSKYDYVYNVTEPWIGSKRLVENSTFHATDTAIRQLTILG